METRSFSFVMADKQAYERDSFTELFREYYTGKKLEEYSRNFSVLKRIHNRYDPAAFYGTFAFPEDSEFFNLGGTIRIPADKEFPFSSLLKMPFIHFVKRNEKWYIESIFMCK